VLAQLCRIITTVGHTMDSIAAMMGGIAMAKVQEAIEEGIMEELGTGEGALEEGNGMIGMLCQAHTDRDYWEVQRMIQRSIIESTC